MPNVFNIIRHIDTKILDDEVDKWAEEHGYAPIILMSPDTIQEMPKSGEDIEIHLMQSAYNCTDRVGTYEGMKVFSDPSMKYGEVELR